MTEIKDGTTIGAAFAATVARHSNKPFFAVPAAEGRGYLEAGFEISYGEAARQVEALAAIYRAAGYGIGHRVATLLENRPEYVLHKLALNGLGVCCVPSTPTIGRLRSPTCWTTASPTWCSSWPRAENICRGPAGVRPPARHRRARAVCVGAAPPSRPARRDGADRRNAASILYTSGTTGRPKGCILSHGYELASGAWYASLGGVAILREGQERIYNPLPLYHANAGVVSLMGAIVTGNCQVQPDRFHPQRWWYEIAETKATVVHYLGIIAPLLLSQPPSEDERRHHVRFGIGAGIEPQLHAAFEVRFGFPMVELWGMTEMVRVLADNFEPRQIGTRAFGRAVPGIEVRVVDERPGCGRRGGRRDARPPLGGDAAAWLLLGLPR